MIVLHPRLWRSIAPRGRLVSRGRIVSRGRLVPRGGLAPRGRLASCVFLVSAMALAAGDAEAQWQYVDSLDQARDHFELVRLDDGRVLAAGGHQPGHLYATGGGGGSSVVNTITRFDCTATQLRFRNAASVIIATVALTGSSAPTLVCSNPITTLPLTRIARLSVDQGIYNQIGFFAGATQIGTVTFNGAVSGVADLNAGADPLFNRVSTATQSGDVTFSNGNQVAYRISLMPSPYEASLATAERYDPTSDAWSATGALAHARRDHALIRLRDGSVLAIGGIASDGSVLASVERFTPSSGTWSLAAPMPAGRMMHTATRLLDGRVLVVGGQAAPGPATTETLLYDPSADAWTVAQPTSEAHRQHTATLLQDGRVLVFGNIGGSSYDTTGELFVPATGAWQPVFTLPRRDLLSATLLHDGRVLLAGGYSPERAPTYTYDEAWLFDPRAVCSPGMGSGGVAPPPGSPLTYRPAPRRCPVAPPSPIAQTGSMSVGRSTHRAGLRPDGLVLVAGGNVNAQASYSSEVYDPKTGTWSTWSSDFMNQGRLRFGAVMLDDGELMVAGGHNALALATAEKLTPLPLGRDCLGDLACESGLCVDGVCCDDRCDGTCEGCFTSLATKGTCLPEPDGYIPVSDTEATCAPYRCDGVSRDCPTSCSATHATCYPSAACDANGECGANVGATCHRAFECTTNYCIDRTCAVPPTTPYRIVYLPGRTSNWWDSIAFLGQPDPSTAAADPWKHVQPSFNNYQRLYDNSGGVPQIGTQAKVRDALLDNCVLPNQCVVMCFSTGCARYLLAVHDIAMQSPPAPTELDGLLWVEAVSSVAGGTELSGNLSKWWEKLLKKIMCKYVGVKIGGVKLKYAECKSQPIDDDLTVSHMRNGLGHIQNGSPVAMFHGAGRKDMKLKIWFLKFSLNKYFPGDHGDGVVPVHSAGGYAQSGAYGSLCLPAAKYVNRVEQRCELYPLNHYGMFVQGVIDGSLRLLNTPVTMPYEEEAPPVSDALVEGDATYDDADLADSDNPTHTSTCNGACCFDTSVGLDVCQ